MAVTSSRRHGARGGVVSTRQLLGVGSVCLLMLGAGGAWANEKPGDPPAITAGDPPAGIMGFLENRGQADGPFRYYAPGSRVAVYFTEDAVVLDLKAASMSGGDAAVIADEVRRGPTRARPRAAVWIRFAGANPGPRIEGRRRLPTRYNFFVGSSPAQWFTNVSACQEIVYHDLWPGVDLVFRDGGGEIYYAPVTDEGELPPAPLFACEGAERVTPEAGGNRIETPVGTIHDCFPVAGSAWGSLRVEAASPVPGEPGLSSMAEAALMWCTYLGGTGTEEGRGDVGLDSSGHVILTGCTESSDFPVGPGAFDSTYNANGDVFVAQLDSAGIYLLWCSYLGGSGRDQGKALALNAAGEPFVAGVTESPDFPRTEAVWDTSYGGAKDAFVAQLDASGSSLRWSTYLGGSDWDEVTAIALMTGQPVVTGFTWSTDFPTTPGAYATTARGGGDAFVAKLSGSGSTLLCGTYLGGLSFEQANDLAVDESENLIIVGETQSTNFPTTEAAYDRVYGGNGDAFLAKLDCSAESLLAATYVGGTDWDQATTLVLVEGYAPIVAGFTWSPDFPATSGAYDRYINGGRDGFIFKMNAEATSYLWGSFLGGTSNETIWAVVADAFGNPVVTGETRSSGFPVTLNAWDPSFNGDWDCFLSQLTASGSQLVWSSFLGGTRTDVGAALALDSWGRAVVTGWTRSEDFPATTASYDPFPNGNADGFAFKMDLPGQSSVGESLPAGTSGGSIPAIVFPNPSSDQAIIRFRLPAAVPVRVSIHQAGGRLVRTLAQGSFGPGEHTLVWDGRNARGERVRPGVYFVRVEGEGVVAGEKVLIVE